jgi:CRISPR system Cascade subunit CasD
MMDILVLRFDAPLISFGAPIVDNQGEVQPYPALSMITGLVGNALGVDHSEPDRLERLQDRLRYASRQDRRGRQIQDYQTVDLSEPYMDDDRAWTTHGHVEARAGGSASDGTHIRYRDYWADAVHTVVLTLDPPEEAPALDNIEAALRHPARPLFLGRKPCLPASALLVGRMQAESLPEALVEVPLHERADAGPAYPAWWPTHPEADPPSREALDEDMREPVTDRRDWTNQIHVGQRWIVNGTVRPSGGRRGEPPGT